MPPESDRIEGTIGPTHAMTDDGRLGDHVTVRSWSLGKRLVLIAFVALASQASPARAANPCRTQCAALGKACRIPYQLAYQAQRAGCTGIGRRLCITAARIMYFAGRTLCRSVATSCLKCCGRNSALCAAACGNGIVDPTEDCDPPGWASCPGGIACGADCSCPPG